MIATCPIYGPRLDLTHPPRWVVSFVLSATETLFAPFWLREQLSRAMEVQA